MEDAARQVANAVNRKINMLNTCKVCEKRLSTADTTDHSAHTGILCTSCIEKIQNNEKRTALLESFDMPVLLMQANPRQVVTANNRALEVFGKQLNQVEGHRGGEVFDCIHSFTDAGCGKDINCEGCRIKDAIINTFETGCAHTEIQTELTIRNHSDTEEIRDIQISTQIVGKLTFVSIDHFKLKH
jgi:hypothetical protein